MISTGLLWLQCGGRSWFSASIVSAKLGQLAAARDQRIGGQHAGPPAFVTIVRRGPARPRLLRQHLRHVENLGDAVDSQARRCARNAASSTSSLPASAPVCDAAALAAASVRPALITMIGLVSATSRAAERKDRASPMVSM